MSPTPNRLEDEWGQIQERILREWDLLTPEDLGRSRMEYDQIVRLIRKRYGGRTEIIQEAAIRDTLNRILQKLEA